MIHVHYSNRTEQLLTALVGNLRAEGDASAGAFAAAFAPIPVVVPNRNVETYLKLGLAQARGIAANLEVSFLRGFLARVAERTVPDGRVVDLLQLEGHLLALLHDEDFLARATLGPVRDYLRAAGAAPAAIDRRRCQLAALLAKLFDEYATSRPELLSAWTAGRTSFAELPVVGAIEDWERALWIAIFGADGLVAARSRREGRTWLPLGDLLAQAQARGLAASPRALHVFGVSYMARGYHRMLASLGRAFDVRLYTLNPCREFWEDVETAGELRRRLKKDGRKTLFPSRTEARQLGLGDDPLGLASEGENLALRLWGRPGRENVRLLNQLTDGDFEGRFVESAAPTLLARLQNDVLDRVAQATPDPTLRADDSLTLLRCPGLRRELEVVAAEIWRLVRADPTIRFNDVAVVVPESRKDLYLSHVPAVFGEAHALPHSLVDLPLGGGHRLGEAVELLLALPEGTFTRRELLPLLIHPSILARFPEASAAEWVRLVDELGILHGADHGDHAGTYIAHDLFNWDQGLRRLALGTLMTGPRGGDESAVAIGASEYLPADPPAPEASALSFALLARSLIADARFAAGADGAPRLRPLPEWIELIRGLLTSYLVPVDDEEEALLGRCLRALQELDDVEVAVGDRATPVSYLVAADLARRAFARLGGARGQYLASGVTVASFVPMRAIPFRAVFVLGLGHGLFPSAPRRGQLDLREVRRTAGDVSPREQDLYLFLETLLCARDKLVLSYVARDELTGEVLPLSSVLLELREILAAYLSPDELKKIFEAPPPPLRRYDDQTRLGAAPLAQREHVAKALGQSLRSSLAGAAMPDLPTLGRALPPELRGRLATRLDIHAPPPLRTAARDKLVVPLAALRQFLEDPLQGSARFRLRLREVEGDELLLEREEEPFETSALDRSNILREAIIEALLSEPGIPSLAAVVDRYRRLAAREELAGRLPTGIFREALGVGHEQILAGWLTELRAFAAGQELRRSVTRFGHAGAAAVGGAAGWLGRDSVGETLPPIRLEIPGARADGGALLVELVGRTELVLTGDAEPASVILSCGRDEQRDKDRLRGFLDHVALAAHERSPGPRGAVTFWSRNGEHRQRPARFAPVTAARARAYLTAVVAEMLTGARDAAGNATGVHDYLLPIEGVMAAGKKGRDAAQEIQRLRDNYFEKNWLIFSSVLGPVPEAAERHEPPPPDEVDRMIDARFGLYFELLEATS